MLVDIDAPIAQAPASRTYPTPPGCSLERRALGYDTTQSHPAICVAFVEERVLERCISAEPSSLQPMCFGSLFAAWYS